MATMRGRKRTDDPTPNRARDIQRAFRARRAAHLQSLEDRILELEGENQYFRKLLNLPPAHRQPLGKGPTGRGVAKSRSRLNNEDFDKQCASPEPSDSSATPPIEYSLTMPASSMDMFGPLMTSSTESLSHNGPPMEMKLMNEMPSPDMYSDTMLPASVHQYPESEGNGSIMPFGYHGEEGWPVQPDVPVPAEITPTMETARYFYASAEQPQVAQQAPQSIPVGERPINFGHRRSNTEPQSFGSMLAPFAPSHRSHNSQSFVSMAGHDLTPSPPPPPIRSTLQGFR